MDHSYGDDQQEIAGAELATVDDGFSDDEDDYTVSEDWVDPTPLMPSGDDLIYHPMRASLVPGSPDLALEETDRLATGFGVGKTTYYMGAEEREDYRLGVNEEGQLVDAEGNLYSSGQDTHGHYPGSTGGDIFVMDQGGVFAADVTALQDELNQGTEIALGQGQVVHHSTLAAGQRDENEDGEVDRGRRLRVAAAGELVAEDGEVRSISDASGHFLPEEDQTLQFVETLQGAGVNLDNTKINLVGKPVFDGEGGLRGVAPAVNVYSGEFVASEGDQIALANKRSVMDQIAGRATGAQTEGDSEIMDSLARRRESLDAMAEGRARRFKKDDGSASDGDGDGQTDSFEAVDGQEEWSTPSGEEPGGLESADDAASEHAGMPFDNPNAYEGNALRSDSWEDDGAASPAPFGNPNAYAAASPVGDALEDSEAAPFGNPNAYGTATDREDSLEDAPFGNANAYSAARREEDSLEDDGPEGDSSAEESAEDAAASGAQWQGARSQGGRSGVTMGRQRGQAWQDAAPPTDQRSGPQIGTRRGGQ